MNISLLFIVSSLVLTFFHIFVFQVTDLPKIEFEENENAISNTLKYSLEENDNKIVHTRFWIYVKFLDTFFYEFL